MKKSMLSIVAASVLVATVQLASAQTSTTSTSTWTTDQGTVIREYSTNKKYAPFHDPNLNPNVGMALPGTVTLYPLPETIIVPNAEIYSYSIINGRPVVVDRVSRKVIHTWE